MSTTERLEQALSNLRRHRWTSSKRWKSPSVNEPWRNLLGNERSPRALAHCWI